MKTIKHEGTNQHRLNQNMLEKVFADEWREMNSREGRGYGTLEYIMAEKPNYPNGEVTQRDAIVAASVVQWLGSPVGQSFIETVLHKASLSKKKEGFDD